MNNMQFLEFHFNPPEREKRDFKNGKIKDDLIFDSFCYAPENIYEKKVGNLSVAGAVKNVLPNNTGLLDNLARVLEKTYYKSTIFTPEKSLKESLKKANEYLESVARKGDVSWLGNICLAVLSIAQTTKGYEFNFTKVGEIKIFLLRSGHLIDIDQKLQFEGIEPYPLKIFGNIVSGKLAENDVILVFTKDVLDFFQSKNVLFEICQLSENAVFDSKRLKDILTAKKEELLKIRGLFLAAILNNQPMSKEKERFLEPKILKIFSFAKNNFPELSAKGLRNVLGIKLPSPAIFRKFAVFLQKKEVFRSKKGKFFLSEKVNVFLSEKGKIFIPQNWKIFHQKKINFDLMGLIFKKNSVLVLVFTALLALGFFIFQEIEKQQIAQYQNRLNQIEENVRKAENYLITAEFNPRSKKQANTLLKESAEEISSLLKISPSLPKNLAVKMKLLQEKISGKLYELNKLKIIAEPELFFEFQSHEFTPQKMTYYNGNLYFFNPFSENIFELESNGKGNILSLNKKFALAANLNNSVIFLSKSGEISNFQDGKFSDLESLKHPYSGLFLYDIASYLSNLYILDNKNKALVKYSYMGNLRWSDPQIWLKNDAMADVKSIAVDGSLWALTTEDFIEKYYAQKLAGNLKFDIYPEPKNFSKIFAADGLPYLYISEPSQKRIVILNKSGEIQIQIQSQSFDEILDFAVSENGKTIYILNGMKVYKVEW